MKKQPPAHLFDPKPHLDWFVGHPQFAATRQITVEGDSVFVTQRHLVGDKWSRPITRQCDAAQAKLIIAELRKTA